ncbi:hypothetical protein DFQ26_002348 [Actinomortierella ambigua]|nr:hypothetical protein DFQ26_002348 [Actinomortierella ambigua]
MSHTVVVAGNWHLVSLTMPPKRKTAPAGSAEENGTSKTKGGRAKAAKTAATTTANGVTKGGRSRKAKAVEAEEEVR